MRHVIAATGSAILMTAAAQAASFGFQNITGNSADTAVVGVSQLGLTVVSDGGGMVRFKLSNSGPVASVVTGIWVQNSAGLLSGVGAIDDSPPSLAFSWGVNGSLPGGGSISFTSQDTLGLKSLPPPTVSGINSGETLEWTYQIAGGFTTDDVVAAMVAGQIKLGVHMQSIQSGGTGNGGSEGFVTVTTPVIPAPFGGMLAGAGLVAIGARRRR